MNSEDLIPIPPQPTERFELTLSGLAYGGEAFGREPTGKMVFVPFTLPGERVKVEVTESHKRWLRGKPIEILQPSPDRVSPRCRHYGVCGGCHYQHMPYPEQLQAKVGILQEQFRRIAKIEAIPLVDPIACPEPWNYRNSLRFHLSQEGQLGFVNAASDGVMTIRECHLPLPELDELWPLLDLEPDLNLTQIGLTAGNAGSPIIELYSEGPPKIELNLDIPASAVWLGGERVNVLAGEPFTVFNILGRDFQVSAGAFFQTNTGLIDALVDLVMSYLDVELGKVVYDLYAGVGLFSAFLAQAGAKVIAVEQSPIAGLDFEVNLQNFDGIDLYEATVEDALPAIKQKPDAILVDPPRAGLRREVIHKLTELAPERIVYVSCDPATLARDSQRFTASGYRLEQLRMIDLFPQTFHIETVSLWRAP